MSVRELGFAVGVAAVPYADGLRGRKDAAVQTQLVDIDRQIADLEAQVASADATLGDSRFRTDLPLPALSTAQLADIDDFALQVAGTCTVCHQIRRATIARVQKDQRVLTRAQFNHSAHVLQRGCLTCHAEIPVFASLGIKGQLDPAIDNASIQNLPRVATCQACHTSRLASDQCTTCHLFHPTMDRFSPKAIR